MQAVVLSLYADCASLAGLQCDRFAGDDARHHIVGVDDLGEEAEGAWLAVLVAHLRLHMDHGFTAGDVEVGGVNISSCGAEVAIERQSLVKFAGEVQVDVLWQSAVVGIEVAVVPLVSAVEHSVAVGPTVVAAHRDDVVALLDIRSEVEAEGHHAVVGEAHLLAVEPYVGSLSCPFKLDEHLALHLFLREGEVLAVPHDGIGEMDDILAEGLITIEGMGQCDLLPGVVVERGVLGLLEVADL